MKSLLDGYIGRVLETFLLGLALFTLVPYIPSHEEYVSRFPMVLFPIIFFTLSRLIRYRGISKGYIFLSVEILGISALSFVMYEVARLLLDTYFVV